MATKQKSQPQTQFPPPLKLDPISEWRAWQALQVYFTVLLNRQLHRRWQLEQKAMQDLPVSQRFRPVILLEPIPTLRKPLPSLTNTTTTTTNKNTLKSFSTLKVKVHLLRARVEKGKELASEIERRMANPSITFPTHFCHTCVVDGESGRVEVLLTKCGHRVCRTCLAFAVGEDGVYECSICFAPAQFVEKTVSPLGGVQRSCSKKIASVPRKLVNGGTGKAMGRNKLVTPLVCPK